MEQMIKRASVMIALVALFAVPATAQVATIDYFGFGWEDGGIPSSNPGDVLEFTGVADFVDPLFGVSLAAVEVTFHASGLVSTGEIPIGGGTVVINYVGGSLDVYVDAAKNADWGVFPPNATSPSTFMDGTLLFGGGFTSFTLFLAADGSGAYEGTLDGLAGTILGGGCSGCGYTWGGAFAAASGAQIPAGYDLQIDGEFEVDAAVSNQDMGWGRVKSLYGN